MQRYMPTCLGALLVIAMGPVLAQDQPPPPPADPNQTYTLAARYAVGDLLTYKTHANMSIDVTAAEGKSLFPAGDRSGALTTRVKTVGLLPDGGAVVATTAAVDGSRGTANLPAVPQGPAMLLEVDRRGRTKLHGNHAGPAGMSQLLSQMSAVTQMVAVGAILPDHPVKIGDTWETDVPMPIGGTMRVTGTLLGFAKVGDVETLQIKQVMTLPIDVNVGSDMQPTQDAAKAMVVMKGAAVVNGIWNILEANARLVKMAADVKGDVAMELKGDAAQQSPFGSTMNLKIAGKMAMTLSSAGRVGPTAVTAPKAAGDRSRTQNP